MSDTSDSCNRIIDPAPAQAVVSAGNQNAGANRSVQPVQVVSSQPTVTSSSQRNVESAESEKIKERERAIKDLNKQLRVVNNICDPICDYIKFQKNMNPEVRALIDINQWMMMLFALKAAVKTQIDYTYMDIQEPPSSLKESMTKAYDNLDSVSNAFSDSMKEVVNLLQSQSRLNKESSPSTQNKSEPSVLEAMVSDNRLP